MKLSLAFVFITALAVCFVAGQSKSSSMAGQTSAMSGQGQITNGPVAEYISDSDCTIAWSTSAPGSMTLLYGTDRAKMTEKAGAKEGADGRNYHVRLDGLKPNTRYFFQVVSMNEPVSGVGTFQTVAQGDQPVKSKATIPQ